MATSRILTLVGVEEYLRIVTQNSTLLQYHRIYLFIEGVVCRHCSFEYYSHDWVTNGEPRPIFLHDLPRNLLHGVHVELDHDPYFEPAGPYWPPQDVQCNLFLPLSTS